MRKRINDKKVLFSSKKSFTFFLVCLLAIPGSTSSLYPPTLQFNERSKGRENQSLFVLRHTFPEHLFLVGQVALVNRVLGVSKGCTMGKNYG